MKNYFPLVWQKIQSIHLKENLTECKEMKKFKFKFILVLEKRREEERQALLVFSHKQKNYNAQLTQKAQLLAGLQSALIRREVLGTTLVSVIEFQSEQSFIEGTKQRILQADHRIFRAYKELERAHFRYLEARKKTKMIETLETKAVDTFKKEVNKRERKELEDLMIMRFRLKGDAA